MKLLAILGALVLLLFLFGCSAKEKEPSVPESKTPQAEHETWAEKAARLSAMQDLDEIFALENDNDFAVALLSLLDRWIAQSGLDALSPEARAFYLCNALDAEVSGGGFCAFFYNPGGEWGPETVEALEAVGAPQTAELFRQFIALFPCDAYPRDLDERNTLLLDMPDSFETSYNELDEAFFTNPDGELRSLYISYAREHRDCFSAPAES